MIFSKRRKVTSLAEEWCDKNGVPYHPFNIVTALDSLGLLLQDIPETKTTHKCPDCGNDIEIKQPEEHSEYVPCGTCKNCMAIFCMLEYRSGSTALYKIDLPI